MKAIERLVVNATPLLSNLTGVGQVTAEVSRRLLKVPDLEVDFFTPLRTFSDLAEIQAPGLSMRALRRAKKIFRKLPFKTAIRRAISQVGVSGASYDLYWEPNFIPNPAISAAQVVTTIHDMSFHQHPEWHPRDRVAFFSRNFFRSLEDSDIFVTVSEFSRAQFLDSQSTIPADRVRVIPCGVDHSVFRKRAETEVLALRQRYRLPERFVLCVGSIEPRKNLMQLLSVYELLPIELRESCPLVLVGDVGWRNREIYRRIRKLGPAVRVMGYLASADELAVMYNAAEFFVYPSLYEGFGIPPLEAMACETPVCLSDIPVFRERYSDQEAFFFDPREKASLQQALLEMMQDASRRQGLAAAGAVVAKGFSWDRVAADYQALFLELTGQPIAAMQSPPTDP